MGEIKEDVLSLGSSARDKYRRARPVVDEVAVKSAEVIGKAAIKGSKNAAKGSSKGLRLFGRNLWGSRKGIVSAVGALALGVSAGKPVETKVKVEEFIDNPAKVTREAIPVAGDALTRAVDEAISKVKNRGEASAASEGSVTVESKDRVDELIDIFYPNTLEADKEELGKQIVITSEYMKDLMTPQSYENLKNNQELINDTARYSGVPKEVFVGLVMAESRGGIDGNEPNNVGALGPVQITELKGKDYGLNITNDENDDRLKWDRALAVAAMDISRNTRFFSGEDAGYQNWGLGVWSWHKGQTGVKEEIENYSANKAESYTDLKQYIRENNVTVKSILDIKNIRERLEDPENNYDTTTLFVLRVAGGALLYSNLQKIAEQS